ncbi:DNA-binding protein c1d [Perkinsus chesapeaki]|uniref:Nuclear nucleic acid-binding protein C1D n=1 Tax=Perkinsus chesapeaki TaxID=330153 RepID=A0A7J6MR90_PERCH|nr:DNA-binding protein c1d [Perkinsus chesapeaki]
MAASSSSSGVRNSLIKKLDHFEAQLSGLEEHLKPLMDADYEEVMSKMTPLEQSELNVSLAFTTASLYWMFLKTQGTDVKTHKIKDEIDRVKSYMARIKKASEQEDVKSSTTGEAQALARKRDVVLDKEAAARIVKANTTEPTVKNSVKRKAEESSTDSKAEQGETKGTGKRTKKNKKSA